MRRWIPALLLAACLPAHAATNLHVQITGDRLTVRAERAPLRSILERFAEAGVSVRVDPDIDVWVTGRCHDSPMEEALDALLQPYAYILVWELVPGPLGDWPKLAEMQVFAQGRREATRPLEPPERNFRIASGPLPGDPPFVADEILLGMKPGITIEEFRLLLRQIGGTVVDSIPELGVYRIRLPRGTNIPDLVAQLQRNPAVSEAEPNYAARLPDAHASPAPDATVRGDLPTPPVPAKGAAPVAVLDSGLVANDALANSVVGAYDAVLPGAAIGDPDGHGTQMALIAAGGITPEGVDASGEGVPVLAVRAFDDNGYTSNFTLMRAMRYAAGQGARVLNLSWGSETRSQFVADAVAYAQSKGIIVVAAAGNEPSGRAMYPAAYADVVGVSALAADGSTWSDSNYGRFVSVAAPGFADFPVGHNGPPGTYAGTSIASAYVARELSVYLTRHPNATAAEALAALREAVTDAGEQGRDARYGFGALDAAARQKLRAR